MSNTYLNELKQLLSLMNIEPIEWDAHKLTYKSSEGDIIKLYIALGFSEHYFNIEINGQTIYFTHGILPVQQVTKMVAGLAV